MKMSILILTLLTAFGSLAQSDSQFPNGWEGNWEGPLQMDFANGKDMQADMALHIHALSDTSWQWKIIYKTDSTEDIRDYTLFRVGQSPHYSLDEHNGIQLYLSSINNGMYSSFDVAGSDLMIFYELEGDQLIFRTISAVNGGLSGGEDDIPEVLSRKTVVSQKAILKRSE